jgi:hypothetical protein
VVVIVVMKPLAAKAFVKAFAAVKSFTAAKAPATVKDPSATAVKAATTAVEVGNGRWHPHKEGCGNARYENSGHRVTSYYPVFMQLPLRDNWPVQDAVTTVTLFIVCNH